MTCPFSLNLSINPAADDYVITWNMPIVLLIPIMRVFQLLLGYDINIQQKD